MQTNQNLSLRKNTGNGITNRKISGRVFQKDIKDPELDFEGLAAIVGGHTAFQLMWAAVEFDLFSLLSKYETLDLAEIADKLNLLEQPTRILLQGLHSLRLIKFSEGKYRNAKIAEKHLVRNKPGCLAPILGWQHHIVYRGMTDFTESLKENRNVGLRQIPGTGDTLYERLKSDAKTEKIFQDAMSSLSSNANKEMAENLNIAGVGHLVDLGGGDATNIINLAKRFPHLRASVFDSETVIALALRKIKETEFSDRLSAVAGNFFTDPLPENSDCFLLSHILTIWSKERNQMLIRKIWEALKPGGKIVIFNMAPDSQTNSPLVCALGSPYFQAVASGEGMLYAKTDYCDWLNKAGFQDTKVQKLPMEHLLITAVK